MNLDNMNLEVEDVTDEIEQLYQGNINEEMLNFDNDKTKTIDLCPGME